MCRNRGDSICVYICLFGNNNPIPKKCYINVSLFELLLFPGVLALFAVAADFLFRRGFAGGRVSEIRIEK